MKTVQPAIAKTTCDNCGGEIKGPFLRVVHTPYEAPAAAYETPCNYVPNFMPLIGGQSEPSEELPLIERNLDYCSAACCSAHIATITTPVLPDGFWDRAPSWAVCVFKERPDPFGWQQKEAWQFSDVPAIAMGHYWQTAWRTKSEVVPVTEKMPDIWWRYSVVIRPGYAPDPSTGHAL